MSKRGYVAPQSIGSQFRYRRRRILRGFEHSKKPELELETTPEETVDSSVEGTRNMTIEDIIASEG